MPTEPRTPADIDPDLISVVVIGRNEGERLRRCLTSIHEAFAAHPHPYEIIYVDSASTDSSITLAESLSARTILVRPDRPSAAIGRNAGWRIARGATILFLDGDTILHPRFVADSLPDLAQPHTAIVWGHRREIHPEKSLYNCVLDLDWLYPPGPAPFCGGDALFRREVLEQAGGYNDALIAGEEPELCRRIIALGWTIQHPDRPMTTHDLAITRFSQYWKRASRAGHAYAEVSALLAARGESFWQQESRHNRNRALTLLAIPLAALILSIVLRSFWPIVLAILFFVLISLRSAWRARWKSPDNWSTLLLYGAHSHLQQIPIFFGQLQYRWNRRTGKRRRLVEYK